MNEASSPRAPHAYPRRVLLAVSGLSPQIVTETLYALAVADASPTSFVPTEVRLVTTREGAHRARLALLSDEPGWFHRLRREHGLPEIVFGEGQIHVLSDAAGAPLDDIRTPQDNLRCADAITDLVRDITADADCALHVSPRFEGTGFLVGIDGADGLLPDRGKLRLGGDGRSAQYRVVQVAEWRPDLKAIAAARRFRLILRTPGLFGAGWLPDCVVAAGGSHRLQGSSFVARLVCAAVGRREVVSGWDLHKWAPKPAEAAAPAGSVYWFDDFSGDSGKLADWVAAGLSNDTGPATPRRAEGYNLAWLAAWPEGNDR